MAAAWFIGPYVRDDANGHGWPTRFFLAADFFEQLAADGGAWRGPVELLGNHGLVKVRAAQGVLDAIAARAGVDRIPKDRLDDPLSDFTPAQKQRMRDLALGLGYTLDEINTHLPGNLGNYTLGELLRFLQRRWRRPFFDGVDIAFEPIDRQPPASVDALRADES